MKASAVMIWRNPLQAWGTLWRSRLSSVTDSGWQPMSDGETPALRAAGTAVAAAQESDDGFDFLPTAHPGRELFTASLFVLLIVALFVWTGSKLILAM